MLRRAILIGIAAVVAGFFAAAPAYSGDTGGLAMTASKSQDGPFTNQPLSYNLENGDTRTGWFKVKNRTNQNAKNVRFAEIHKVTQDAFGFRFFHKGENVTKDVRQGNYRFDLGPSESTKFKLLLRMKTDEGGFCLLAYAEKGSFGGDDVLVSANTSCT